MHVSIADIADAFPDYRVAFVVAEGLTIAPERPAALDALIAEREAAARARWGGTELVADSRHRGVARRLQGLRHQADALSLLGRAAGEERARRPPLARVNAFVDLYNAVSLAHVLPLGADDLDQVTPPLRFRYCARGRQLRRHGARRASEPEAPKAGRGGLCRRRPRALPALELAPGRPLASSRPQTRRAVVTVQANGAGDVAAGANDLVDLIGKFCGGHAGSRCSIASRPSADL